MGTSVNEPHLPHIYMQQALPYFFPFYFLGGRGWPGEEATLDMSLFLARVEVNLVGRCFLLTSTAADNGSDRNWVFASSGQSSLASGSIIPFWCIECWICVHYLIDCFI